MKHPAQKAYALITLGFFVFSLMVLVHSRIEKTGSLQELIVQVQELQQSSDANIVNFTVVFSDTISTLQNTAGLQPDLFTTPQEDRSKTIRIVVQTRIPYLLAETNPLQKIELSQSLEPWEQKTFYKSHLIPPETPPPITIC